MVVYNLISEIKQTNISKFSRISNCYLNIWQIFSRIMFPLIAPDYSQFQYRTTDGFCCYDHGTNSRFLYCISEKIR